MSKKETISLSDTVYTEFVGSWKYDAYARSQLSILQTDPLKGTILVQDNIIQSN